MSPFIVLKTTHISEAVPVLDLATVLGNGGQPLFIFHEIPRFLSFFPALNVHLHGKPYEHQQRDENTSQIIHPHHFV